MEVEYRALIATIGQMEAIKILLEELGVQVPIPQKIKYNNLEVTFVTQNTICHTKLKHIVIDFHFIKEKMEKRYICAQAQLTMQTF